MLWNVYKVTLFVNKGLHELNTKYHLSLDTCVLLKARHFHYYFIVPRWNVKLGPVELCNARNKTQLQCTLYEKRFALQCFWQ